ncbi:BTB/POZ protein [Scenedesmus sp. NREL 46B-D3]|nr:BTB/POZ protein [Scenedesmus sp. NREL 46B-D3]
MPNSAGEWPKATLQLHLHGPDNDAPVPGLPHTFRARHFFGDTTRDCATVTSIAPDSDTCTELCTSVTFIQLEWSATALAVQGLQLTDSLKLHSAVAPSGAPFFGSEQLSDCTVVAGGQTLFCHKLVLSMASSVFRAMFRSGMGESSSSRVEMRDADPEAVTLLLQAIYGQEVVVPLQHLVQLAHLADQYQTAHLTDALVQAVDDSPIVAHALAQLLPAAVAAGGTDRLVRSLLDQVVSQVTSIRQAPDLFQQWSPQALQLVAAAAGERAPYEALQGSATGLLTAVYG